ncbi:MAG: phosphopantothenate/pantothenate synthetase [Methanosarcinales archaeon]|nr:phosphopantothenate/pantothenate synthetase [Methanosarcinales archaeon]
MTEIPKDHPRYNSLITRELIAKGIESGITSIKGLIAQGRGEAFDYLIGEITTASARDAQYAATAMLLLAQRPIISVNGNSAALVPNELVELSSLIGAPLEVNLFYRTEDRVLKIIKHLKAHGAQDVLGADPDAAIPGLSSERGKVCRAGIYSADVVFVPLEDGDRCEALMSMGKQVIAVDLNPLSRTAQKATITIVDNITRAMPNILKMVKELNKTPNKKLIDIIDNFDNKKGLDDAIISMCKKHKVSK